MKKNRHIAAFAALAMVASMAAVPMSAGAETKYSGLITSDTSKDNGLTASVTYKNSTGADTTTPTSYNATELKKVFVIEDTANIPAVSFTYTATAGTAVDATASTLAVRAGLNPAKIKWVEEKTKENADANDTFDTSDVGTHSAGTAGASYELKYAAQDVHDAEIKNETDTYTVAAEADNVLINNTSAVDDANSYYAIKTLRLDFTDCEFTEPGIYRYIITEAGDNKGVTNDTSLERTIDVYVEDATYTTYKEESGSYVEDKTEYKLRIAGYVMYNGKVTAAPPITAAEVTETANNLEDGLDNTMPTGAAGTYGTPNGAEVAGATKSEGFKNTYKTHDLTFDKTVTGNQGSRDKYFKFTLKIENAIAGTVYDVDLTKADAEIAANPNSATTCIDSNVTQPTKLTADSNGTITQVYYLQHGQSITVKGLTDGTSYTVEEAPEDYKPTSALGAGSDYKTNDGETTEEDISTGEGVKSVADIAIKADTTVKFTNDRSGIIPTGVIISIAAPVVLGIIIIGGLAFLHIQRKRRKSESK